MSYMIFIITKEQLDVEQVDKKLALFKLGYNNEINQFIYLLGDGHSSHMYVKNIKKERSLKLDTKIVSYFDKLCKNQIYFSFLVAYAKGYIMDSFEIKNKEKIALSTLKKENFSLQENIRYIVQCN